jgi:hypothetical protein
LFGYGADEAFSAWYIASYIQEVIEAGKAEYNLPMFVNAWIDGSFSKNLKPDYPIGGPVSKMFDIWRAAAPLIDVFAADIYIEDIKKVCEMYSQQGNPIFIPEAKESPRQAANVYYVIGQNGMCFAPFGIDGLFKPEVAAVVAESYKSLKGFLPFFAGHCGKDKNKGLLYTGEKIEEFEMGSYKIRVEYLQERDEANNLSESGGLILNSAENEFYICGFQIRVHFSALQGENKHAEVISHDEGVFDNGKWMPERRMNGDELGIWLQKPTIRKVKFHKYDL